MGQALKSPLRIPALDHGIAESVDDLVVGTDDSRIAAKSLDQRSSSMPNSPLSQACTASLGASFRRDSKRCRSRMSWKYAHYRLQVQGAQAAAASAERFCGGRVHAAVVGPILDSLHARREKPGADRRSENVARIGLLPRVKCLRSLISANTPRRIFPWRPSTRFFPFWRV